MRKPLLLLLLGFIALRAQAQCVNTVEYNFRNWAGHVFVVLDLQCNQNVPDAKPGDAVTITSQKQNPSEQHQIAGTIAAIASIPKQVVRFDLAVSGPGAEGDGTLDDLQADSDKVDVSYNGTKLTADLDDRGKKNVPQNVKRYKWAIGPASKSDNSGSSGSTTIAGAGGADSTTTPSSTNAMRLQVEGEYARDGFFGQNASKLPFRTHGTLSIDTTNSSDPSYIDNNQVTLGLQTQRKNYAAIKQLHFGIEGRLSKAAHQDVHDGSVVATFSAWFPEVPSITILSSVPAYIAPPLSIALSYGYGNKQTSDATYHGRSGDATVSYLLYAYDKYELAASEKWTLNDLSNRPATIPRTQKLFKVQISYLENPATGFKVAASYEDGSIGPVLTKVKQYFIGVALSKFSFSGASK